jgi:hypothetical protein
MSGWTISCPSAGPGRPPELSEAEVVALAVAQVFLDCPNDRKFLALGRWRLGHLFPALIKQPGYNKRVRALAPQIISAVNALAFSFRWARVRTARGRLRRAVGAPRPKAVL